MNLFRSHTPLLMAAAILLAGNGLQGTLLTLRAGGEGFATEIIGLMGTTYYLGFLISSLYTAHLIRAFGHIRVFAALAALGGAGTLAMLLWIDPFLWVGMRMISGFCFSGLLMVIESWLNESTSNEYRGHVFSIYRIVDLVAVTGAQFLIPVYGTSGHDLFIIVAIFFSLSLIPVSLSNRSHPKPPGETKFDPRVVWGISPLACAGTFCIGLTNAAFRLVGPLYGQQVGLGESGVALFISAGILGGAVLQYPLGRLSDKFDRRIMVLVITTGAALAGLFLTFIAGEDATLIYIGAFAFGAFALTLYSVSAAHAYDFAKPGQHVLISAGITFFFALGASIGPLLSALVIEVYGASAFFTYTSLVHLSLIAVVLFRMTQRSTVPAAFRTRFVALLRTSPEVFRLARKDNRKS